MMPVSTAQRVLGVAVMFRVALTAGLAVAIAGCSLGSSSISSGFDETPKSTSSLASKSGIISAGLGGEPSASRNIQLAKLDDKAPNGTFEKAPAGALADRDYTQTSLNAEMARERVGIT